MKSSSTSYTYIQYAKVIRILSKGYLPTYHHQNYKKILGEVKKAIWTTNLDYDIVIQRLHVHYDMKLVSFGIDKDRNLIGQFPVFVQPYTQQPLILYQIETVPVPIIHWNQEGNSYTHLQIDSPYIVLYSETYILTRQQECRTCKKIGYEFYCEVTFHGKI